MVLVVTLSLTAAFSARAVARTDALGWSSDSIGGPEARQERVGVAVTLPAPGAQAHLVAATEGSSATEHPDCIKRVPRATKDRPDLQEGSQLHIIYLVPSDFPDEKLDKKGVLDCSARAQNDWFIEASGGYRWRFDTFEARVGRGSRTFKSELVDVTFVRSARPGTELDSAFEVQSELSLQGFAESDKRYLSFVATESGACGDAVYPFLPPPSVQPQDGKYAQVYLFAAPACRSQNFGPPGDAGFAEMIAQQEVIHNDGLVSPGAPHGCCSGSLPVSVTFARVAWPHRRRPESRS